MIDNSALCNASTLASATAYTEGVSITIAAADNGKKVCFSSTDMAGNIGYGVSAQLSVAGGVPTRTWTPVSGGYLTSLGGTITLAFGSDVYSNSSCTTELNDTTADNAVTLGTTSGGNDIATTVTYTASTNTITIDPDSNLADDTTYYAGLTNAWHYQNGACAPGAAESISFTTDAGAPTLTISPVSGGYVNAAEDDSGVTVSGTTTDADSGSDVDLTFTNGSNTVTKNNITVSSNTWSTTLTTANLTTLTTGTISISGTVDDTAGNTSTATQSFVYDTAVPTVTNPSITTSNSNASYAKQGDTITITFDFSEEIDESNTAIKYQVGSGAERTFTYITGTVTSGKCKETTDSTDIYTCKYTIASGDTGLFKAKVSAFKDIAGNSGTAQTYNATGITVDTTAPVVTISGQPVGTNDAGTLAVTVAGAGVTHYRHKVIAGTGCTSGGYGSEIVVATAITDTISTLADGSITLCVVGKDSAGNWQTSATSATWIKDTTAPTLTITAVSGGYVNAIEDDSGVTISGTTAGADSGSDVDLTLTNGSNTVTINDIMVSSDAWTTTLTLANLTTLTEGTIAVSGTVDDTVGNTGTAAQSFVYDITAPVITAPAALITTEGVPYDLRNGVVTITGSDSSRDTVSVPSGVGVLQVTVRATDTAGNTVSTERLMVVLPQAVITAGGAIGTVRVVDDGTDVTGGIGYPSGVMPAYTGVFAWRDSSYVYLRATEATVPTAVGYTVTDDVSGYRGARDVTEVGVDIASQAGKQFTDALVCLSGKGTSGIRIFVDGVLVSDPTVVKGAGFVCLQHAFASAVTNATFAIGYQRSSGAAHAGKFVHFDTVNKQAVEEPVIHRRGDSHPEVKQMQILLNRTSCTVAEVGAGSSGNETEYFGPKTEDALFCFQSAVGLNQTGTFDPPTRYALFGTPAEQQDTQAAQVVRERISVLQNRLVDLLDQLRDKLRDALTSEG